MLSARLDAYRSGLTNPLGEGMAVDIVLDVAGHRLFRRAWRGVTAVVGFLFILAAMLASTIPILVVTVVIGALVTNEKPELDGDGVRALVVASAVMVVGLFLGLRLIRGRRRLVLFLRRFGFVPATHVLSFAVAEAAGRRWRLVTLDDLRVVAVGVRKGARWTAASAGVIGLAAIVGGVLWIFAGPLDRFFSDTVQQATPETDNPVDAIGAALGAALVAAAVVGFFLAVVVIAMAFFGATTLFALSSYRTVRKAERSKAREIRTEQDIERTVRSVSRGARRTLGARLVVVRVASGIWKPTVTALANSSAAIVIDVSEPTQNLLWEITTIKPAFRSRWILVGRLQQVTRLTSPAAYGDEQVPVVQLATLLDGEQILAYGGESRSDMKRFARALRAKLEQLR